MPYEDESLSIPPEPAAVKHRRRGTDHVDWRRVAVYVMGSSTIWAPALWYAAGVVFDAHAQWLEFAKMPGRIADLERSAKEHEGLDKRLASLERYRCILGYDPGGKLGQASILPRDRRSECRTEQKAPEQ